MSRNFDRKECIYGAAMSEECSKKTYGELYAIQWGKDLDSLTSLSTGFTDKVVFGLQAALAASEILTESAIASFITSLSAEIGLTAGTISSALGGAADLMLSGVSASTVVSNLAGEGVRRLFERIALTVTLELGPGIAATIVPVISEIAVPVLSFLAVSLAAFAAKVGVEALDEYNKQENKPLETLDIRQSNERPNGVNEGVNVEHLLVYDSARTGRRSGISILVEGLKQYDFDGLSSGIQYPEYSDDCAEQIILSDFGDVFNLGNGNYILELAR